MYPPSLMAGLVALILAQDSGPSARDLDTRVARTVHRVDARWVLVGASGSDDDRIHQWRRVNEMMTVAARQFETDLDAERHVRQLVSTMPVRVAEKLKMGSFGARIEWGDGRSSVYLAIDRTAVVISAPSAELARRLSRQAAVEFSDHQLAARSRQR